MVLSADQGLILVLTGGVSRRMGEPKALMPLLPGGSGNFLQAILSNTIGLGRQAIVSSLVATELKVQVPTELQKRPELGQLSSLKLGWEAFGQRAPWVMVCLVDHPYVARSTTEALVRACQTHPEAMLWTPSFEHKAGHPVIFSAALMGELMKAPDEHGARPVVRRHQDRRHWVNVSDPAVLWDVDTPEDYHRYSSLSEVLKAAGGATVSGADDADSSSAGGRLERNHQA